MTGILSWMKRRVSVASVTMTAQESMRCPSRSHRSQRPARRERIPGLEANEVGLLGALEFFPFVPTIGPNEAAPPAKRVGKAGFSATVSARALIVL